MEQKEIAKLLGVSPAMVSMALRGQGRASPGLRAAILDLARRHHVGVRKLHKRVEAETPGAVLRLAYCGVQEMIGWFHIGTFSGMSETTLGVSYDLSLILAEAKHSVDYQAAAAQLHHQVSAAAFDGLIAGPHEAVASALEPCGLPLVQIGYQEHAGCHRDMILPDNFSGARRLAAGLLAKGCRRLAVVRCLANENNSIEKFAGIRAALEQAGIALDPRLVVQGDCHKLEGARCAAGLCADDVPPPDAIILENDWHASEFVAHLRRNRPQHWPRLGEIAFAMFCDSERTHTLTTACDRIMLPRTDMGRLAIRRLLERLAHPGDWHPQTLRVSPLFLPAEG